MDELEKEIISSGIKTFVKVEKGGINIQEVHHFHQAKNGSDENGLMDDDTLRDKINKVLPLIKQNRHWFCIIKVLMLRGQVKNKDFKGAAERIRSLYPGGLDVEIDPADLQSMHIGSFMFPLSEWNLTDGPFKREFEFKQYLSLAQRFDSLFD